MILILTRPKGAFFFLLQSEEGDLYKVTIEHDEQDVKALKIKYFDTVPIANSLCILKSGFLFVASEFGNQLRLYAGFSMNSTYAPCFTATCISSRSLAMTTTNLSSHPQITLHLAWRTRVLHCLEHTSDRDHWII